MVDLVTVENQKVEDARTANSRWRVHRPVPFAGQLPRLGSGLALMFLGRRLGMTLTCDYVRL